MRFIQSLTYSLFGLALVAPTVSMAGASLPRSGCLESHFTIAPETISPVYFRIKKNGYCSIIFSGHPVDRYIKIHVVEKPKHGTAGVNSEVRWAYQARNNYVGKDKFILRVTFEKNGKVVQGDLEVFVTVTEN